MVADPKFQIVGLGGGIKGEPEDRETGGKRDDDVRLALILAGAIELVANDLAVQIRNIKVSIRPECAGRGAVLVGDLGFRELKVRIRKDRIDWGNGGKGA